jgi:hypothetical protein
MARLEREANMSGKLEPIYVPADDVDLYDVPDEGWYAIDEDHQIADGPFASRVDCLLAIYEIEKPDAA